MKTVLKKIAGFISGKMLPRRAYRVWRGHLRGTKFILGSLAGEGGGASVYFGQIEPEQTDAMSREFSDGAVFFDVGANVGYYSLLASKKIGEKGLVAAFEPVISNLAFLHRHVELNDAKNIRILPFALSDKQSVAEFFAGENSAQGRLAENIENDQSQTIYVPTISLDEIAAKMNLSPDVLKIDVEGAEMEVLRGAKRVLREAKPTIFLSTHSNELRADCLEFLRGIGYKINSLFPEDADSHEFRAKYAESGE